MTANLEMAKAAIENNTGIKCKIEMTWIDFGANWAELQLIGINEYEPEGSVLREYQILNPKQVEDAKRGMLSMDELQKVIDKINERGW